MHSRKYYQCSTCMLLNKFESDVCVSCETGYISQPENLQVQDNVLNLARFYRRDKRGRNRNHTLGYIDVCTHVSWNQAPLHSNQLGASLRKYERNKADEV